MLTTLELSFGTCRSSNFARTSVTARAEIYCNLFTYSSCTSVHSKHFLNPIINRDIDWIPLHLSVCLKHVDVDCFLFTLHNMYDQNCTLKKQLFIFYLSSFAVEDAEDNIVFEEGQGVRATGLHV